MTPHTQQATTSNSSIEELQRTDRTDQIIISEDISSITLSAARHEREHVSERVSKEARARAPPLHELGSARPLASWTFLSRASAKRSHVQVLVLARSIFCLRACASTQQTID